MPVSSTTDRLVMTTLISPGTPTLRMSANRRQRSVTPVNRKVTSARAERRCASSTRLPTPNEIMRPQPAPAGPSAGSPPPPKISSGDRMTWPSTLPTITAAGRPMLPVPRTALPSKFSRQIDTAPLNATVA